MTEQHILDDDEEIEDPIVEDTIGEDDEEVSYADLYNSCILNGEIIITIPNEFLERTKRGIRNYKAKLYLKCKEDGVPTDSSVLSFSEDMSKEFPGCTELHILSQRKATVKIKKIVIPENLPE